MPRPKLAHVANLAGVSLTTASVTLRDTGRTSPETRARLQEAADRLGYIPDARARRLRVGSAPLIGVVMNRDYYLGREDAPLLFWPLMLTALTHELTQRGMSVAGAPSTDPGTLQNLPLDALVTVAITDDPIIPPSIPKGLPMLVATYGPNKDYPAAFHDVRTMVTESVDHLLTRGATKPGLLTLPLLRGYARLSLSAYEERCRETGVPPTIKRVGNRQEIAAAVESMIGEGVDAILHMTGDPKSVTDAVLATGRGIPDDVMLLSQSIAVVERAMTPSHSFCSLLPLESATLVAEAVSDMVGHGRSEDVLCPHKLVPMASTARR